MKKKLFLVCMSLVWTVAMMAQQIAVVSESGTQVYRTLQEAIEGAPDGSVIYLPGGGFPIADEVKITKKLTIYGIGHKSNNDNVDGVTTISGNLFFNEGSSGSAVMACYITGNVNIGEGDASVNDVMIKHCYLSSVQVLNNTCLETEVNQCYLVEGTNFHGANGRFTNNISKNVRELNNGVIEYNIFNSNYIFGTNFANCCTNSYVKGNILLPQQHYYCELNRCYGNMCRTDFGVDPEIIIIENSWNDVFVNYNEGKISPSSDFHFKNEFKQYQSQVGIYAGTGFSDDQLAPIPYIVSKRIPDHTDAEGKLNIKIRVKAGEGE